MFGNVRFSPGRFSFYVVYINKDRLLYELKKAILDAGGPFVLHYPRQAVPAVLTAAWGVISTAGRPFYSVGSDYITSIPIVQMKREKKVPSPGRASRHNSFTRYKDMLYSVIAGPPRRWEMVAGQPAVRRDCTLRTGAIPALQSHHLAVVMAPGLRGCLVAVVN